MKIKTLRGETPKEIDEQVVLFETEHKIKFTQTHVTYTGTSMVYTYVLFYEE